MKSNERLLLDACKNACDAMVVTGLHQQLTQAYLQLKEAINQVSKKKD